MTDDILAAARSQSRDYRMKAPHQVDPDASRRARNNVRRGKRRELYVQRTYGPTKVGQYGDAIDNLGHDWKWQSKTQRLGVVRDLPDWAALLDLQAFGPIEAHDWITTPMGSMAPLHRELAPLLIRSWTYARGHQDIIVVRSSDWAALHGGPAANTEFMAMTGAYFLDINGRDER